MKIKLLQWNILYKDNIDNIIKELKRINADIVCIQELSFKDDDFSNIAKLCELYKYVDYEVADTMSDGRSQCNAILSNYPLRENVRKYVQEPSTDNSDYSKEGRIYLEDKVIINDYILNVGTTHLSYTDKFIETELKDIEVNNLINILKGNKNKFIFVGDLNTNRDSKYIKELSKYLKYYETSNTWTTKPFSYNGFEEDKLNWKLDHVFTTNDVNVINVEVINTKYSDHLPILIEIEL